MRRRRERKARSPLKVSPGVILGTTGDQDKKPAKLHSDTVCAPYCHTGTALSALAEFVRRGIGQLSLKRIFDFRKSRFLLSTCNYQLSMHTSYDYKTHLIRFALTSSVASSPSPSKPTMRWTRLSQAWLYHGCLP